MSDLKDLLKLERRLERKSRIRNYLGLAILLAALGWSAVHVAVLTFGPTSDTSLGQGKKVIRFAHWQLEARCVKAVNEAIAEYEKLHPDVAVQQIEVHERAYEQWVRTQLIGRTAPDLIELRWGGDFIVRYFVPLTEIVQKPNPYNDPNSYPDLGDPNLAGRPWRETYIDDMQGGWNDELRDYYGMPLSVFTVRCYANKDMLRQIAGFTDKPRNLGEFLEICRRVKAYEDERKKTDRFFGLDAISGSDYTANVFTGRYWDMAAWGLLEDYDENCDGWIGNEERIEAVLTGKLDLATNPYVRAGHQIVYDISRYFSQGFMSARRDESVLAFAQGKAAMIATGSWDAGGIWKQAEGDFEIAVFDFPVPSPGQPYSEFIRYRPSEAGTRSGFPMGLTRFSQHKDIAIDFMRFLTTRRMNEELNRKFRWFPAIRGARPDPILEDFRPKVEGTYKPMDMHLGTGDTMLRYQQGYNRYISAVDPQLSDYQDFIRAAQGDRQAFVERYSDLAKAFLKGFGGDLARFTFDQYVRAWRDEHYNQFIRGYSEDLKRYCLADLHRIWVGQYHSLVEADGSLAEVRARAMREGITPKIRRNMVSLVFSQVSRIDGRTYTREVYERMCRLTGRKPEEAGQ